MPTTAPFEFSTNWKGMGVTLREGWAERPESISRQCAERWNKNGAPDR